MQGRALERDISSEQYEWDTPLPPEKETQWKAWTNFLTVMSCRKWTELCVFADASTMAIAAVAYLRVLDSDENKCRPCNG